MAVERGSARLLAMHRPTSIADQTAWWLVSVVGVGVVASMTATWLMSTEGTWVYAPSVIAILFIIVTVPGGVLSPDSPMVVPETSR